MVLHLISDYFSTTTTITTTTQCRSFLRLRLRDYCMLHFMICWLTCTSITTFSFRSLSFFAFRAVRSSITDSCCGCYLQPRDILNEYNTRHYHRSPKNYRKRYPIHIMTSRDIRKISEDDPNNPSASLNDILIQSTSVSQADIGLLTTSNTLSTTVVEENDENTNSGKKDVMQQSWRSRLEVSSTQSRSIRGSNYVQLATVDRNTQEPRCRTVVFRGFLSRSTRSDNGDSLAFVHHHHPNEKIHVDGMSCIMKMITDQNSEKVKEIYSNAAPAMDDPDDNNDNDTVRHSSSNNAELVWWFPHSSEQYRIRGTIVLIGGGDYPFDQQIDMIQARTSQWNTISDSARESFYYNKITNGPGTTYNHNPAENEHDGMVIPSGGRDVVTGQILQPPPSNFLLMLLIPCYCDYLRLANPMYRQIDHYDALTKKWYSRRVHP
jgi:pyridoxamine 5'-phosphate oxidase